MPVLDLLFYPVIGGAVLLPAAWVRRRLGDPLEALALGAGYGVLLWAGVGLARFFLVLPSSTARTIGLVALAASAGALVIISLPLWGRARVGATKLLPPLGDQGRGTPPFLLAIVAAAALTLGLEASLPHFDLAERYYDWFVHFDLARVFHSATAVDLARHWGDATVTTRTPLYNLLASVALTVFGDRFSVFQVLTAAVAWLWILPFALLARRLLNSWAPAVTALAAISPLVLHTTTYASSKGLVTFFALLALERYLALREAPPDRVLLLSLQLGLFSAATVMSHSGFVGFPLALVAMYAWEVIRRRRPWRGLATTALTGALVAIPWYAWAIAQYGFQAGVFGYPRAPYASVLRWLFDRLLIPPTSFLPVTLPLERYVVQPLETYFLIYIGTATGALGLVFLFRALAQNLNRHTRIHAGRVEWPLLCFAVAGILVADVLHEGVLSNNASTFCVPGMLALLLLAVRANPLTRFFVVASLVEMTVFEVVVLLWVWSPASSGLLNAEVAQANHLRFLGQDALAAGLFLVATGLVAAAACVWPWIRMPAEAASGRTRSAAA